MYPRIVLAYTRYTHRAVLSTRHPIHTSIPAASPTSSKHSTDAYNKDVDTSPPEDTTTYFVDPDADVQKSTAPPSGDWSRAGTLTSEYETVDTTSQPYAAPGETQRYGNTDVWAKDKGLEPSRREEGPEGKAAGGRKPEKKPTPASSKHE